MVAPPEGSLASPDASESPASSETDVLARIAAVGDIACSRLPKEQNPKSPDRRIQNGFCQYDDVAQTLEDGDYDRFLPLGDIQYLLGKRQAFRDFYGAYFGDLKPITMPVAGNHESYSPDFAGYRSYFKKRAHWDRPGGYYSYNVGSWHMIALNSMWCRDHTWSTREGYTPIWSESKRDIWGCRPGDPMYEWLLRDIEKNADRECTLAYFHHPAYFYGGYAGGPETLIHPGYTFSRPLYRALYAGGADVVLTGHEHIYQRFLPMNPAAELDPEYGFTQFISGLGGDTKQPSPPDTAPRPEPLAETQNTTFGFLELALKDGSADYAFVPATGEPPYEDAGSIACHGAPPLDALDAGAAEAATPTSSPAG